MTMNKDIRRFLISTCVVFGLLFIADIAVGKVLYHLLDNMPQTQAQASRTNFALNKTQADCIIIGNSRASEHYVSNIIADSIGMSVYNAGRDGHYIAYNDGMIHAIFERYTPKMVIFEYEDDLICSDDHVTINDLKPYYYRCKYLQNRMDLCNKWSFKYAMHSNLYVFNNFPVRLLEGYVKAKDVFNGYCSRGETHINDKPINDLTLCNKEDSGVNEFGSSSLDNIINLCQDNNCLLIITTSPKYSVNYSNNPLLSLHIAGKKNIFVVNNMNIVGFHKHPEWFSDHGHLNGLGAEEYSKVFASQLKKELSSIE